jgi:hypothetical protein
MPDVIAFHARSDAKTESLVHLISCNAVNLQIRARRFKIQILPILRPRPAYGTGSAISNKTTGDIFASIGKESRLQSATLCLLELEFALKGMFQNCPALLKKPSDRSFRSDFSNDPLMAPDVARPVLR